MLTDLHFIGGTLDAVLIDSEFPDGSGTRVLKKFKQAFPDVPAAIVADVPAAIVATESNSGLRLWTNMRGVDVLNLETDAINIWLHDVQLSVQK